jgi:arabinogalactan endo-1,4-beta-galactosidase
MPAVFDAMDRVLQDPGVGVRYWEDQWLVAVRGAADAVDRAGPRRTLDALRSRYEGSP